jgi:hypothetical protein
VVAIRWPARNRPLHEFAIGSRRAADQAPSPDQYRDMVRETRNATGEGVTSKTAR